MNCVAHTYPRKKVEFTLIKQIIFYLLYLLIITSTISEGVVYYYIRVYFIT